MTFSLKIYPTTAPTFINDRRKYRRYDMLLKVRYSDPTTKIQGESITKNISRIGIRFPIYAKLEKGTKLHINIEDPNSDRTILTKAVIVWVEEFAPIDKPEFSQYELGAKLLNKRLY